MYKKRMRRWGIRKRTYRKSTNGSQAASPTPNPEHPSSSNQHNALVRSVQPSSIPDFASLETILDSVSTWSTAMIHSGPAKLDPMARYLSDPSRTPSQDSRTMYRTFELVFDLWSRGNGELAGKAARKGFLALEHVLSEDHPDMIWHVLDTIYDMLDKGHLQLLEIFLQHAKILGQAQLPSSHPVLRILEGLKTCDYKTEHGRQYICYLLRQGWLRNANLLGDCISSSAPQSLWLYEQLIWDGRTRLRRGCDLKSRRVEMSKALKELGGLANPQSTDTRRDKLRIDALTLEFTQMDLEDKTKAKLLASKLISDIQARESTKSSDRFEAYALKMLSRTHENQENWEDAEQSLRMAIVKREKAHGTIDIRVIRDMWVLANHLERADKSLEASFIVEDALSRADRLLQDI